MEYTTMDVDVDFKRAVAVVGDPKNANAYNDDTKLKFYSLYKQAMDGDLPSNRPTPSVFQVVARAKHKAWEELKGMSKNDAKKKYIETLQNADPTFLTSAPEAEEETASNQPLDSKVDSIQASVVSAPAVVDAPAKNVMFVPAIAGCAIMVGAGIAGFLFTTLSWSALFFVCVMASGVAGLVGSLLMLWDENGLISILPGFFHKFLFDMTLLEFIVEDKFLVEIKEIITQILPAYLARDEAKMYETLSLMTPRLRQVLTTKGMARLLSPTFQRILLPRAVRELLRTQPPSFRLPAAIKTDSVKLTQVVMKGKPTDKPDLDRARELFRQMFAEVVSKRNVDLALAWLNPKVLQRTAYALSAATALQLAISSESRRFLFSFIRGLVLLVSMIGAGGSAGLLAVWILAKKAKKNQSD